MSVLASTIMTQIVTACSTDFTAGESGLDMSVSGLVQVGEYLRPSARTAFIAVSPPSVQAAQDGIANLATWGCKLVCNVSCWTPSAKARATKQADVLELASDVIKAIQGLLYPGLGGSEALAGTGVIRIDVSLDVVDGMEPGMMPNWGLAILTVEVAYQRTGGI